MFPAGMVGGCPQTQHFVQMRPLFHPVRKMAIANPSCGAPGIQGELLVQGWNVFESTVFNLLFEITRKFLQRSTKSSLNAPTMPCHANSDSMRSLERLLLSIFI